MKGVCVGDTTLKGGRDTKLGFHLEEMLQWRKMIGGVERDTLL